MRVRTCKLFILLMLWCSSGLAQNATNPPTTGAPGQPPVPAPTPSSNVIAASPVAAPASGSIDLRELRLNYDILRQRLEANTEKTNQVYILLAIFVGMLGFSAVAWFKSEHRATESHNVAILGERAAQNRDVSIFEQSQRTLSLVNETLELAKEASARASKSLENRLRKTSHELEKQCADLIEEFEAYKNDKNLVSSRETTSKIHSLGLKIKALANNLVLLEDETLQLEPHCGLINGLDSHLREDYNEAITSWETVVSDKDTQPELRSLALYWLAYIHNNLGKFKTAVHNLDRALEDATGSRKFELRRLQIESRFFNKEETGELITLLERLLEEFDKEFPDPSDKSVIETKRRIQTTLGNVCFQAGNERNVTEYYERSKRFFKGAGNTAKWSSFGLAETLFKLGERDTAIDLYKGPVLKEAEKEFIGREELRTKILAKTTQLVCAVRTESSPQHIKDLHDEVTSRVGDIDGRLTIYSQLQRRNVSKDEFLNDLARLTKSGELFKSAL